MSIRVTVILDVTPYCLVGRWQLFGDTCSSSSGSSSLNSINCSRTAFYSPLYSLLLERKSRGISYHSRIEIGKVPGAYQIRAESTTRTEVHVDYIHQ